MIKPTILTREVRRGTRVFRAEARFTNLPDDRGVRFETFTSHFAGSDRMIAAAPVTMTVQLAADTIAAMLTEREVIGRTRWILSENKI